MKPSRSGRCPPSTRRASPSTTARFGPADPLPGEIPSDADILQDLGLLHTAGFNLLRLFGADDVSEKILRLAAANYPEMRFQQGISLSGIPVASAASCQDPAGENDKQINRAIALANKYPNVVAVSRRK